MRRIRSGEKIVQIKKYKSMQIIQQKTISKQARERKVRQTMRNRCMSIKFPATLVVRLNLTGYYYAICRIKIA